MKRIFIVILMLFVYSVSNISAQLQVKIKKLEVSSVIADTNNVDNLFFEDGPYVKVTCVIKNVTDTVQRFQLRKIWDNESDIDVIYCYNYNNRDYRLSHVNMFPELYVIIKGDTIYDLPVKYYLEPHETIEICSGISIFRTTPILSTDKFDYRHELLTILPTLKVILKGPQVNLETTEIQKVSIDYKYIP